MNKTDSKYGRVDPTEFPRIQTRQERRRQEDEAEQILEEARRVEAEREAGEALRYATPDDDPTYPHTMGQDLTLGDLDVVGIGSSCSCQAEIAYWKKRCLASEKHLSSVLGALDRCDGVD